MMDRLLILIPALPLAAFLLLLFFGRALGRLSHWPVILAFAGSCVMSFLLLFEVQKQAAAPVGGQIGYEHIVTLWTWADVDNAYTPSATTANPGTPHSFNIEISLRADPLTVFMLAMVTF